MTTLYPATFILSLLTFFLSCKKKNCTLKMNEFYYVSYFAELYLGRTAFPKKDSPLSTLVHCDGFSCELGLWFCRISGEQLPVLPALQFSSFLCWTCRSCLVCTEVPSAPSIVEVRPFSTTALIQYEEPESTGGVPVLKYKALWRMQGKGDWVQRVYEAPDGKKNSLT